MTRLIDSGKVAADYYPVAILDNPANQNYSSRAGAAAHCVADESIGAFRRFHAALFNIGTQPAETGSTFPDNAALTRLASQAGAAGGVAARITSGNYLSSVIDTASAEHVSAPRPSASTAKTTTCPHRMPWTPRFKRFSALRMCNPS